MPMSPMDGVSKFYFIIKPTFAHKSQNSKRASFWCVGFGVKKPFSGHSVDLRPVFGKWVGCKTKFLRQKHIKTEKSNWYEHNHFIIYITMIIF